MNRTIIIDQKLSIKTESGWQDYSIRMSEGDCLTVTDPDGEKIKLTMNRAEVKGETSYESSGPTGRRWSYYAFDECAYCGEHMGIFADTYEFNRHYCDCQNCRLTNMSGYIDGKFVWRMLPGVQKSMHPQNCNCGQFEHRGQELTDLQRTVYFVTSTQKAVR